MCVLSCVDYPSMRERKVPTSWFCSMCPADSVPSPCRGLCAALSVVMPLADPWRRAAAMHAPASFGPTAVAADPWMDEYGGDILTRKLRCHFTRNDAMDSGKEPPFLPKDPRLWSRDDVAKWVLHVTAAHQLPTVHLDRFLMNGKALCLMTIDMFVSRVPLGGKLLYKDFQLRLSSALYS